MSTFSGMLDIFLVYFFFLNNRYWSDFNEKNYIASERDWTDIDTGQPPGTMYAPFKGMWPLKITTQLIRETASAREGAWTDRFELKPQAIFVSRDLLLR